MFLNSFSLTTVYLYLKLEVHICKALACPRTIAFHLLFYHEIYYLLLKHLLLTVVFTIKFISMVEHFPLEFKTGILEVSLRRHNKWCIMGFRIDLNLKDS